MDVFEAIRARKSIRKYQSKAVEQEKLERVLEAGRLAPSAANKQPWHFIVVTDPSVRDALIVAHQRDQFYQNTSQILQAPIIIVVCAEPNQAWTRRDGEEFWKVDLSIALQNMILCATEEGLGTCWIAAFNDEATRKVLKIPEEIKVVAITPLGYPDEEPTPTDRKLIREIVHYNQW